MWPHKPPSSEAAGSKVCDDVTRAAGSSGEVASVPIMRRAVVPMIPVPAALEGTPSASFLLNVPELPGAQVANETHEFPGRCSSLVMISSGSTAGVDLRLGLHTHTCTHVQNRFVHRRRHPVALDLHMIFIAIIVQ